MKIFLSALALIAGAACASAQDEITLQDALSASLQHNPQLAGYQFRRAALAGEQTTAALRPISTWTSRRAGRARRSMSAITRP